MNNKIIHLNYRPARTSDLRKLIELLANDPLGQNREDSTLPINPRYLRALEHIDNDSNNVLYVVEQGSILAGMLQLTFIPSLTHTGSWRCQLEGVRVHQDFRNRGIGSQMFEFAIQQAKDRGCSLVQLTSDKMRQEAKRFYESIGFTATHEGMKLKL
ncbi:GNAT family N-acetyltransferase [Alteromonas facilis]|uniref:GNAT family N-acetyltransferase n=1 Tax=Alteromonas facilis TaxID=2048004 RepID=UPI000C28CEAB|nr:GNAT family N-acetyltransferase [Alteromonas facilis]